MKQVKNRNNKGRPTVEAIERKSYFARVRLSTEDYYLTRAKAREAAMNMSEYIRSALKNSQVRQRLTLDQNRLILALIGMGNNLNQLAKRANQAGYLSVGIELNAKIAELDNVIKQIENDG